MLAIAVDPSSVVIAGLVLATPIGGARPCHVDRGGRDKPGHDHQWEPAMTKSGYVHYTPRRRLPGVGGGSIRPMRTCTSGGTA
jgi:hypothetical protein